MFIEIDGDLYNTDMFGEIKKDQTTISDEPMYCIIYSYKFEYGINCLSEDYRDEKDRDKIYNEIKEKLLNIK